MKWKLIWPSTFNTNRLWNAISAKCDILFSTDITYFCGQILFNCCLFLLIQIQTFHSDTDISLGYRHFTRIQTCHSDTDISFGYRHFIRIQTFYSDTGILFGTGISFRYRHFIRIQTFQLDTDILFRYRHFIRKQTFYSDTNVIFRYRLFSYIVMLCTQMFCSLIIRTGIKKRNICARIT